MLAFCSASQHLVAAIDDDRLAGDEVRVRGGEKEHRASEVIGVLFAF
ncbi:MAG: hypothetical protein JO303_18650 [Caulobacteraceae bacterium]|nr:hypothetical protein [Caulobacteraceae bacterium]